MDTVHLKEHQGVSETDVFQGFWNRSAIEVECTGYCYGSSKQKAPNMSVWGQADYIGIHAKGQKSAWVLKPVPSTQRWKVFWAPEQTFIDSWHLQSYCCFTLWLECWSTSSLNFVQLWGASSSRYLIFAQDQWSKFLLKLSFSTDFPYKSCQQHPVTETHLWPCPSSGTV